MSVSYWLALLLAWVPPCVVGWQLGVRNVRARVALPVILVVSLVCGAPLLWGLYV